MKPPAGGHDDTVMALVIAWQGVTGHKRSRGHADFFRTAMEANAGLTKSAVDGGELNRLPSEYPMGGSGGSRWSM